MAVPRQVLMFESKELPNGTRKTVRDLGIREGTTLNVGIHKIPITIKTKDGEEFALNVEPCDSIDTVKKMVKKNTGMEPRKQNLKFHDEE